MRPVFHFLAKMRARKAAKALAARGVAKHDAARQALIDKLCGELGKAPIKLARRG